MNYLQVDIVNQVKEYMVIGYRITFDGFLEGRKCKMSKGINFVIPKVQIESLGIPKDEHKEDDNLRKKEFEGFPKSFGKAPLF